MLRVLCFGLVLVLAGCATTGMYKMPNGDDLASLRIDNQLAAQVSDEQAGGWQMPVSASAKAAIFKVDGERLVEQGGADSVQLEAGKHSVEVFADQAGILRFGRFRYSFEQGENYQVRVRSSQGKEDYTLELIKTSAPQHVLKAKNF